MPIGNAAFRSVFESVFEREYEDAVVYGDAQKETVLHEGRLRVLGNGWVELPTGRLLSPDAVHHIDRRPDAESVRAEG